MPASSPPSQSEVLRDLAARSAYTEETLVEALRARRIPEADISKALLDLEETGTAIFKRRTSMKSRRCFAGAGLALVMALLAPNASRAQTFGYISADLNNGLPTLASFDPSTLRSYKKEIGGSRLATKHPVIVKRLILTKQTASLGSQSSPIPLFTPDHDGIFRVTAVLQQSGGNDSGCGPDLCAFANFSYAGGNFSVDENDAPSATVAYLSKSGSTLNYFTSVDALNTIPYDLAVVIEEI